MSSLQEHVARDQRANPHNYRRTPMFIVVGTAPHAYGFGILGHTSDAGEAVRVAREAFHPRLKGNWRATVWSVDDGKPVTTIER